MVPRVKYLPYILTFDIETTSYVEYKNVKHRDGTTTREVDKKYAWMWIAGIYDRGMHKYYRTWDEVKKYFDWLSDSVGNNTRYVCWVHNLSFEFQFMKDWMKMEDVFCRKAHKVIRCRYRNIEFRCTLALSNTKLATLAKNEHLSVLKAEGDLDYNKVRHYDSVVTDTELGYLRNDLDVVAEYVKKKIAEYGSIENIPMTSTGEVRYLFRSELGENLPKIHGLVQQYSAKTMELQNLLIETYAGAYTHCNYQAIDQIQYDLKCRDIASSYPYQMVSRTYPTMWFKIVESPDIIELLDEFPPEDYAWVFRATFTKIRSKHCHSIISQHKCIQLSDDFLIDNGRVVSATTLKIALNEIDLSNIMKFYDFDDIILEDIHISKKEYLPKELVAIVLKLFQQKTSLKDIDEEYDNYMRSKNRINGVYGSSVFNLLDSGVYFDEVSNMKYFKEEKTWADFRKYTNNPNQYLWYSIGVWVTSYAREQILEPISKMSENAIYCDTDSVKGKAGHRYTKMWEHLNAKYKTLFYDSMRYHNFKPEEYTFFDKHGVEHFMGIFEEEAPYKRFKSLGSKRYLVEYYDGRMSSTVAGAPKNLWEHLGVDNDSRFEGFHNNFTLENCKLTHTYTEGKYFKLIKDYNGVTKCQEIRSGVCLTPADFTMNLSEQFFEFLMGRIEFQDKDIYRYFIGQQKYK